MQVIQVIPRSYYKKKASKIQNNTLIVKAYQTHIHISQNRWNCNLVFQNELKDITKMTQDMKEHKSDFKKTQK